MLLIPFLDRYANLRFLPQPGRYKFEADLALIWIVVFSLRPLIERIPWRARVLLLLPLVYFADRQIVGYRRYAKQLLRSVDTTQSVEYQTAKWVAEHLPGQRVMMPGSIGQWADVFANVPQAGAQPYTTSPNFSQYLADYIIRSGLNAGERDAAISILWLKAFGAQAIAVPGPGSPEYWHPVANPRKFDGVLPVLHREDAITHYLSGFRAALFYWHYRFTARRPGASYAHPWSRHARDTAICRGARRPFRAARNLELGRKQRGCHPSRAQVPATQISADHDAGPWLACAR